MSKSELIQYVDDHGEPTGETAEKLSAQHAHTVNRLAFSCYIFNAKGLLPVTKRAENKKVWPGVWSNSVCGHVSPGEVFVDAIQRRANFELGTKLTKIVCIKKDYSYQTPPFKGIIENEFCPTFVASIDGLITSNPDEISEYKWVDFDDYADEITADQANDWSWWVKDKFKHIRANPELIGRVLG